MRRVVRCGACRLVQFERNGKCVRCHAYLPPEIIPVKPPREALHILLSESVSRYREAAGYSTLRELERDTGLHRVQIWRLEHCRQNASPGMIERLAEALGVPVRWILEPTTPDRVAERFAVTVLQAVRAYGADKGKVLNGVIALSKRTALRRTG